MDWPSIEPDADALIIGDRHMPGAIGSASGFERIEVVTGFERRRPRGLGEKLKAVEETRLSGISLVRGLAFALDPNL